MLSKSEIKDIQSLSHKKYRDELNLFVAEGPKIVNELVQLLPHHVQNIYAVSAWKATGTISSAITEISDVELNRISQLHTPNQVLAVFRKIDAKEPTGSSFTLYLNAIQDPGNFGTIIRTADWFGISDVVCSEGCAELYNPKVIQSTMASIARVNVWYDKEQNWLKKQQYPVYAAVLQGTSVYELKKTDTGTLIIGNESKGINDEVLQSATHRITIPQKGKAESLNAAVATGILLSCLVGS